MVVTHAYLSEEETLLAAATPHSPTYGYGLGGDANNGVDIWRELIAPMGNIRFVFSGHVGSDEDGAAYVESENDCGAVAHQMMANYQYRSWEHSGYVRILQFFPDQDKVSVSTYSPLDERYAEDSENAFEINELGIW